MKRIILAAALMLGAQPAMAQQLAERAPDAPVAVQTLGSFGGPNFWVRPDLLLLGRPANVADASTLWFWSKAKGVFSVAVPPEAKPEGESFCPRDGAIQWLGPAPSGWRPGIAAERQVIRMVVDPATGAVRMEDGGRNLVLQVLSSSAPITLVATSKAGPGSFYVSAQARCELVPVDEAVTKLKALNLPGNTYTILTPMGDGDFKADWSADRGPDGKYIPAPRQYRLLTPELALRDPQPDDAMIYDPAIEKTKRFGELKVVNTAPDPDPYLWQLQLTQPDGRKVALQSGAPDMSVQFTPSPDGCLLWMRSSEWKRAAVVEIRAAPPPPRTPQGMGPAWKPAESGLLDLCSDETRRALEQKN